MNRAVTAENAARALCGEALSFTGRLYAARDAALKRLLGPDGGSAAFIEGAFIYFAGPAGAPPGFPVGAAGPTTSGRMERYLERLLALGAAGFVGKGGFGRGVAELLARYGGCYLCAVGGAGALYAKRVRKAEVVAYPELGCEAIRALDVENMPLICGIDASGKSIFDR